MDLALAFGVPHETLARQMTEREFRSWARYAQQRVLPWRRMEIMLAQIPWCIARVMGGNDAAKLADFLIDFGVEADAAPVTDDDVEAVQVAFAFNPVKKKA